VIQLKAAVEPALRRLRRFATRPSKGYDARRDDQRRKVEGELACVLGPQTLDHGSQRPPGRQLLVSVAEHEQRGEFIEPLRIGLGSGGDQPVRLEVPDTILAELWIELLDVSQGIEMPFQVASGEQTRPPTERLLGNDLDSGHAPLRS